MLENDERPQPEQSSEHGSLDAPEHGRLKGWAFDRENPDAHLTVEITLDGKPFESVLANQLRSDLLAAGIGNGDHSFAVTIPSEFLDNQPHTFVATIAGSAFALQHSPRVQVLSPPPKAPERPVQVKLPESLLSGLSVVIATKDRGDQVDKILRTTANYARSLPVEFIVVDYGSADASVSPLKALEDHIPNLRVLSVAAPTAGVARNHGVALASREVVLFLGDTAAPNVPTFFEQHVNAHHLMPAKNIAVVGKITWPNLPDDRISFLMSHLQGAGEQQFGFGSLVPYTWLDWRHFYPENVSFKRSIAADWLAEGYKSDIAPEAAVVEDLELAHRLDSKLDGGFPVLYYPSASVSHANSYSVRQFIERQLAAGMAVHALFGSQSSPKEKLGVAKLDRLLAHPKRDGIDITDDLLRMIEGAKSWGVVIESNYRLGSQNWHADLLNAIFELSYLQGYVMGHMTHSSHSEANYMAAYRYCMERFQEKVSTAAAMEVFGRFPTFTLT